MAAIVAGAVLGMLAKKGIPHRVEESLTRIQGLAVGLIGLNGVIASMFTVDADGGISDSGGLLLLVSLVLGCLAGELLRIDDRLSGLGDAVEKRVHIEGFSQGFITASIITCVGAMSIVGALNEGLTGNNEVLLVKSTLDFCHLSGAGFEPGNRRGLCRCADPDLSGSHHTLCRIPGALYIR